MKQRGCTVWAVLLAVSAALLAGCGDSTPQESVDFTPVDVPTPEEVRLLETVLSGTVGQYAYLEGGAPLVVRGYGLVVGLAGNGSAEAPAVVRDRLVKQMGRLRIGDVGTGTAALNPNKLIDDLDTAPVVVSTVVPPGSPAGTRLDVSVQAMPKSQTLSLDGGVLYMTEMQSVALASGAVRESRPVATAKGAVFVNPFSDRTDVASTARLRRGRVIGGGETVEARAIRLVLRQPDYRTARILQDAINAQFPELRKVATARNPSAVEIRIPDSHRTDYRDFLRKLTHMYVRRDAGAAERKARELARLISTPNAPREEISMVWEAMGRKILPVVRPLYVAEDRDLAFWAARAGARVGDTTAVDVLADLACEGSPRRLEAIAELGRTRRLTAVGPLKRCLDADDAAVCIAAYEAMDAGGLIGGFARYGVNDEFELDVVPSHGPYLVYVTRKDRPRIVLFGEGMRVRRPVFFTTPDELVTINANGAGDKLSVYRRVGARRKLSDTLTVAPDVKSLVMTLGGAPVKEPGGEFTGLGLTYSQVVSVLYRLCEDKAGGKLPAVFVLQKPDDVDRINSGRTPVGRLNRADES